MMKNQKSFNNILTYENILNEFYSIKRNCRNKKMILKFELNLNQNILEILKLLYIDKYSHQKYRIFLIKDPKYRIIMSENIVDKIVNHLISTKILLPALEPVLIDTNVATRKNKGTDYAYKCLLKYINKLSLQKKEIYVLKIDIKKYFYNINHSILLDKVSKYVVDAKSLLIIKKTLETTNEEYINNEINKIQSKEINNIKRLNISEKEKKLKIDIINSLPKYKVGKGIPIGNMTSQILAVFYLSEVDHYIKEVLKCKYYIRYMDDLVILDYDYNKLKKIYSLIKKEIEKLDLEVNNKSNIHKLSNGVRFLGYTFKVSNGMLIKCNNQTFYRIKRYLNKLAKIDNEKYHRSLASYKGYFQKSNV